MKKQKSQFKINDLVRITNPGKTYSTHKEMFAQMGFKNTHTNPSWKAGEIGRVFDIGTRDYDNKIVCAVVHADGRECLINVAGIELVQQTTIDSATIDRISARLAEIESKLDQLAEHVIKPEKSQTAVEWLVDELLSYDWCDSEGRVDICMTLEKFTEIKATALQMEKQQNSK